MLSASMHAGLANPMGAHLAWFWHDLDDSRCCPDSKSGALFDHNKQGAKPLAPQLQRSS